MIPSGAICNDITRETENSEFPREIFFRGAPLDLGPQGIPEALRVAFGDLESTFWPSKAMPGPQKVENFEYGILFVRENFVRENLVRENFVRDNYVRENFVRENVVRENFGISLRPQQK